MIMKETLKEQLIPDSFHPIERLQNFVHMGVVRNYQKGETVVLPGETIDRIIYVLSGKLTVNFLNDDGRQKLMYKAGQYSIVDRLFPLENCFVHVISEEKSKICFFTKEQLFIIFKQDDEILNEFLVNYSSKCFHFMNGSKEMALYNPSIRVLRLIHELCLTEGKVVDNVYEIDVKLSQRAISEMTGVHFVTICRVFSWLKKENILQKTTNKIIINDLERLKEIINENSKN
ncbi:MAG: Crp/Fnr family transcriptional regulator [Dehalobacter sp.]|uniref:Helix-turn-helix domain-containing protein n=2 Tax=Dehalobacter restrictus TaxID=55583 RepID=A0A857DGJ8_9FIRM|nr:MULTISPECIES: Crp/Fnr family transcriptional regulator [Dehalobacter]MCG1025894.1 Crp/Fnr family transcriptional regulator [Dehalobacter sp.]QGZ99942.1 helix-turn-helix domain-containing protein [Dehalobacter restrictus]